MATSRPSVVIPSDIWVNLYAATSITAGTKLIIQNIGTSRARLVESATQPTPEVGHNLISPSETVNNFAENVGAWAYASPGTILQIEVA